MRASASGAARSAHPIPAVAVGEVVGRLLETVGPSPDLAVVTVPPPLAGALADVVAAVQALLAPGSLLGAVTGVPSEPGRPVCLWAAHLGPVAPFAVRVTDRSAEAVSGLPALTGREGGVLLIAREPTTGRLLATSSAIAAARTGVPLVGAALTGRETGPLLRSLALDGRPVDADAIGVVLGPGVELDVHHRTGTRPIGPAMTVTGSNGLLVDGLDGIPAREALDRIVAAAAGEDRAALRQGIHLALLPRAGAPAEVPDDRVAEVVGMDRATRALALTLAVREGDTVRFHVPDPSSHDLAADPDVAEHVLDADAALLVCGPQRAATRACEEEAAALAGWVDREVGVLGAATPIVSSWGRSHLLPPAGASLVALRVLS